MATKTPDNYYRLLEAISKAAAATGRTLKDITLVAVTKNHSVEEIMGLYEAGCRIFGEGKLQEALPKIEQLPKDCVWHMIGTLQKNKARKAVEKFAMIESVDTPELADKISAVSMELGKVTPVLLQVNVSDELAKHGLTPKAWKEAYARAHELPGIRIEGLMTMAPFIEDRPFIRRCFARLRKLRDELPGIGPELSMGMSHDFMEAVAEGSTMLRIGSLLFF